MAIKADAAPRRASLPARPGQGFTELKKAILKELAEGNASSQNGHGEGGFQMHANLAKSKTEAKLAR